MPVPAAPSRMPPSTTINPAANALGNLRNLLRVKVAGAVLCSCLGLSVSLVWALISVTMWGRCLAIGMTATAMVPLIWREGRRRPRAQRRWQICSGALGLMAFTVVVGLICATPDGTTRPGSPVQQRFSSGQQFPRFSLANLVPEIEQVNLGFHLMPLLDGMLTPARTRQISTLTLDLYRQMERDPAFHALGSAMGGAYADVLGLSYPAGHYYLYVPRHAPADPLPAIVFLHGSVGNFKVYTWVWSQLAEQLGCVIIAPSFGFGNWDRPGGVEAVQAALADARKVVALDPARIHLAGLSNGGLGVCRVADALPSQFCGCILLSPVMDARITASPEFHKKWAGRPMLVVTGVADERVPVD